MKAVHQWVAEKPGRAPDAVPVRTPLVVRRVRELQALRDMPAAIRRLPRSGLSVRIEGLATSMAERLEQRVRDYRNACGCGEGAAAALVCLGLVVAWACHGAATRGLQWSDAAVLAGGFLLALVSAGLAKLSAIKIAQWRFERCCTQAIAALAATASVEEAVS
jgi:hypothetical protein